MNGGKPYDRGPRPRSWQPDEAVKRRILHAVQDGLSLPVMETRFRLDRDKLLRIAEDLGANIAAYRAKDKKGLR